ncbi:MAG: aromatic-ring-hydroxylating dioxygenase subunit beta [Alphaproteobacteria bacterium]
MDGQFLAGAEPLADAALRQRLDDLQTDYAHAIDDGDLEAWPGFFAEDGRYKIVSRENHEAGLPMGVLYCDSRGMMSDRVMALRTANIFEPHTYCHLISRSRYAQGGDGLIRGRTNFQVVRAMQDGQTDLFAVGKYLDLIDPATPGGRPLFRDRLVVLESRRIDVLLCFPL